LPYLLSKVVPIANAHGLTLKQGCGRLIYSGSMDHPKQMVLLPVWTLLRHAKTGQWERSYMELPLAKLDPQAFGTAFTYGRRYVLQAFWCVAGTDDDGVLGSRKARLDADPVEEAIAGMLEQINECKTVEMLKAWHRRNHQGFDLLNENMLEKLREAYTRHLGVL